MKILLFFLLLLPVPIVASAEPYIAMREGFRCSVCHANHTGGGKRTRMGSAYGVQDLPWIKVDLKEKNIPLFWSVKEDLLSVGGDFRFSNQSTFVKHDTSNTFATDQATLYILFKLLPDRVSFYLDESVAPGGAQAREVVGMIENLPAYGWIKFGRFFPNYGIRFLDNKNFTREVTGFTFNNPDLGGEVGFEPGNWSLTTSFTNGTAGALDNNTGKLVVASATYVRSAFRLGASGAYNPGPTGIKRSAAAFGGLHWWKAVLLAEADYIRDDSDPTFKRDQFVAHGEVDYEIFKGWNVKAVYEYFDPNRDVAEDQRDRVVIGFEPFIAPWVQASVFYTFNQSIPQNALQNADELDFGFHLYF
ncbi:MAG TPA: hypothetical protein VFG11_06565 [Acidobacteriota bacterium]|nr:hypothetical protein [Acidobacteriota bacterium]